VHSTLGFDPNPTTLLPPDPIQQTDSQITCCSCFFELSHNGDNISGMEEVGECESEKFPVFVVAIAS
jgi:hypothetical protein